MNPYNPNITPENGINIGSTVAERPLFGPSSAMPKEDAAQRIAISAGKNLPKLLSGMDFLKKDLPTFASSTAPVANANSTIPQAPNNNIVEGTPEQYKGMIQTKAQQYGVPVSILSALFGRESGYNPKAKNINKRETSYGLAQINLLAHPNVTRQQAEDPNFAIDFAAKRLASMIQKYGLYEGIQAYNTPGAIGSAQLVEYANNILKRAGYGSQVASPKGLKNLGKATGGPGTNKNLPKTLTMLGRKTTDFGGKTRYEDNHPGLDFANAKGTPIPSVVSGTITGVDPGHRTGENNFGNRVEITDSAGNKHMYSHLDKISAAVGQKVAPGQIVATMGDSGSAYSPGGGDASHLDYRIVNAYNRYVNPYQYFNKK